jgi:hypothetical protein
LQLKHSRPLLSSLGGIFGAEVKNRLRRRGAAYGGLVAGIVRQLANNCRRFFFLLEKLPAF